MLPLRLVDLFALRIHGAIRPLWSRPNPPVSGRAQRNTTRDDGAGAPFVSRLSFKTNEPRMVAPNYCGDSEAERNSADNSALAPLRPMRLARVINNSAALLVLDILSKAMPLVVFPVMVRALGPTSYGKIGFATAVAGFFGLLASPGFSTYALREAARDESRVHFLVRHVLGARVAFAVASYILLIIFALTFAPHDFTTRLLIVLSGLVFLVNSMDAQWVFTARSRMWMVTLRGAVGQLIYGGLILALIRRPSDAWIVPVATVVSLLAGMFLIWVPARREYHIP